MCQIFKTPIARDIFFTYLDKLCLKNTQHGYYLYNKNAFKKGMYNETIREFIEYISRFYHISKRNKYLEKTMTNITFATILRQICNANSIRFTSKIKYDKSCYDIEYYIYYIEIISNTD
jgi:hypothetical protein